MTEKRKFQLEQWRVHINDRIQSGLNVTEWCKANGHSKYKYYYWLRELQKESIEETLETLPVPVLKAETTFVEISKPERYTSPEPEVVKEASAQPAAVIRNNCFQIELFSTASAEMIREIMKVVGRV